MSSGFDIWSALGIKLSDVAGGIAGGTAAALVFKRAGIVGAVSSVVVGALTSAYLTPWFIMRVGSFGGGASFVVGLCAMAICQAIAGAINRAMSLLSKRED